MDDPGKGMSTSRSDVLDTSARVEEYLLCILFHMLLPFLPLVIEAAELRHIEPKTLLFFFSVYPLNLGVSSQSRLLFGMTVAISIVYATLFGAVSGNITIASSAYTAGYGIVAAAMILHSYERYRHHVTNGVPFLKFT